MVAREEVGCHTGVGLRQRISADHASHMTSVAWDVLLTNVMSRTTDPVLRVPAPVSENVLVHL